MLNSGDKVMMNCRYSVPGCYKNAVFTVESDPSELLHLYGKDFVRIGGVSSNGKKQFHGYYALDGLERV